MFKKIVDFFTQRKISATVYKRYSNSRQQYFIRVSFFDIDTNRYTIETFEVERKEYNSPNKTVTVYKIFGLYRLA